MGAERLYGPREQHCKGVDGQQGVPRTASKLGSGCRHGCHKGGPQGRLASDSCHCHTHTHVRTTQCSLSCTLTYVHTHRHAVLTHMYTLSCAHTGMCTHVLYAHSCTCTHELTMGTYTLSHTCVPALALPPTAGGAQHPKEPGVQPSLMSTAHSSGLRKQMLSLHNKEVLPRVAFRWQCWVALGRDYSSEGKTCLPL